MWGWREQPEEQPQYVGNHDIFCITNCYVCCPMHDDFRSKYFCVAIYKYTILIVLYIYDRNLTVFSIYIDFHIVICVYILCMIWSKYESCNAKSPPYHLWSDKTSHWGLQVKASNIYNLYIFMYKIQIPLTHWSLYAVYYS